MIDRTWWTWQNLDLKNRQYSVAGSTIFGDLTSANTTINDPIDMGFIGVPTTSIKDVGHTLGGPLCYIYA